MSEEKVIDDSLSDKQTILPFMRHKLRTSINTIIGYSELLLEEIEDSEESIRSDLKSIHSAGLEMLALANDDKADFKYTIRTNLNTVVGLTEALLEDARHSGVESFVGDIIKIQVATKQLFSLLIDDVIKWDQIEAYSADRKQGMLLMKEIDFGSIPLFSGLDRIDLAKIIPSLEKMDFKAEDILFKKGEAGDCLYVIVDGLARAFLYNDSGEEELALLGRGQCVGEMSLLTGNARNANVQAQTPLVVLRLTKERFDALLKTHYSLNAYFARLVTSRLSSTYSTFHGAQGTQITDGPSPIAGISNVPPVKQKRNTFSTFLNLEKNKTFIGIALTAALCSLSALGLHMAGLSRPHTILIELILAAAVLWGMKTFNYHAIALALPVITVLIGIANPEKAFSGFSSYSWFLTLAILAISAAISKTGLLYRAVLIMIKRFPPSYIGQTLALALAGLLLTPVIPSGTSRTILAEQMISTICEAIGFKKKSPGTVGIALSVLLGFGYMSFMFMNGSSQCILALGLMPAGAVSAITWFSWLTAALPLGILYFAMSYLLIIMFNKHKEDVHMQIPVIEAQLKILGPLTRQEKISIFTVTVSLLGFIIQSPKEGVWVAVFCFLILLASSVLNEKSVRSDIDWNYLLSFGALVGFGKVLSDSGLTDFLSGKLTPYLSSITTSSLVFLLVFVVLVNVLRFALPLVPALLLSIFSVLPIVPAYGINPFLIALVALLPSNPWILPYQNTMYMNFEGKYFDHSQVIRLAFFNILVELTAVAVSVPYWKHLGLIH